MQSMRVGLCTLMVIAASAVPATATTVVPMSFEEVARGASFVIEGTVVDVESFATGQRPKDDGRTVVPAPPRSEDQAPSSADAVEAPSVLGTEGGRMIHTRVTLKVNRRIVGQVGPTVTFRVAGGTLGDERAIVFGLPSFQEGQRYVVFLRPDFAESASPIVGVNQGFFRLAERGTGALPTLIDVDGDIVVGVEGGRVVVRRDAERPDPPRFTLGPVPTPDPGADVRPGRSPEVTRYWRSTEPPMPPERFYAAVRELRGVAR